METHKLTRSQKRRLRRRNSRLRCQDRDTELEMVAASFDANIFYRSNEWKQLRYRVLKKYGSSCMLCNVSAKSGVQIHVDHIKPRSLYPELAFNFDNLQVLCSMCNEGKSNKDITDWRPKKEKVESVKTPQPYRECKIYKCNNKCTNHPKLCPEHNVSRFRRNKYDPIVTITVVQSNEPRQPKQSKESVDAINNFYGIGDAYVDMETTIEAVQEDEPEFTSREIINRRSGSSRYR